MRFYTCKSRCREDKVIPLVNIPGANFDDGFIVLVGNYTISQVGLFFIFIACKTRGREDFLCKIIRVCEFQT